MKLILEIPLEGNDLSSEDIEVFLREAKSATGMNLDIGRPASGRAGDCGVARMFQLRVDKFKARIEREEQH